MKSLLCILMIASLSVTSAFAAPKTVKDNVLALSQLGLGYTEQKIAGKNAAEIF